MPPKFWSGSLERTDSTGTLNVFFVLEKKINDDLIIISRDESLPTLRTGKLVLKQKIMVRDADRQTIQGTIIFIRNYRLFIFFYSYVNMTFCFLQIPIELFVWIIRNLIDTGYDSLSFESKIFINEHIIFGKLPFDWNSHDFSWNAAIEKACLYESDSIYFIAWYPNLYESS